MPVPSKDARTPAWPFRRWNARWINRGTRDAALIHGFTHFRFADGLVIEWADFIDTATASYLAGWMPEMPAFAMAGPASEA